MRLDKYLSHAGYGTRTEVKRLIKKRIVLVDDALCINPGLDITTQTVRVNNNVVEYQEYYYYMMNKPKGVLSASKDAHQPTVLDLMAGVCPVPVHVVGRLDKDTTGLLLLTNDGVFAHQVISPKSHINKHYQVTLDQPLREEEIQFLEAGVILDHKMTLPCEIHPLQDTTYEMIITEGKYHQIKRMMHAVQKEVVELHRFKIGSLTLNPNLKPGQLVELTKIDTDLIFQ